MPAYKNERRVYMWHVVPKPVPKEAPNVTLDEIFAILKAHYDARDAEIYLSDTARILDDDAPAPAKDPKNRVYIADLAEDDDTITFLVNRGDTNVANPAFINIKNAQVRVVTPEDTETQGWSAHLVIAKKKKRGGDAWRACFERVPHANSYYVEELLRRILERHAAKDSKYVFKKVVRRGGKTAREDHAYKPSFSVKKVESEQIKEDIKKGELSRITLIKTNAETAGLDASDIIKSSTYRLTITPKKIDPTTVLTWVEEK